MHKLIVAGLLAVVVVALLVMATPIIGEDAQVGGYGYGYGYEKDVR